MAGLHQKITHHYSNMAGNCDSRGVHVSDGGPNRDLPNSSDKFPKGLRVLVFDEDPAYLLTLENHLQEFQYEVTRCNEEERAMYLLRNHRNRFDIAIIEVQNPDGDRFRLISEVGSVMDIPIIVMSKDDSVESVVNWMRSGACDYLVKPIRAEDLRLVFKHVVKRIQGKRCVVVAEEVGEKAAAEKSSSLGSSDIRNPNKRKRGASFGEPLKEEENYYEHDHDHDRDLAPTSKKRRVVWDEELHKKFIDAVELIGHEKAVPKKILELMNVDGITRENVASHLQKYRMHRRKQNVQNEVEERNQSLITLQQGRVYGGDEATKFFRGSNVQFPTQINNVSPLFVQHNTNPSLTTRLISPLGHYDGVSVSVSGRNLVMAHHLHQPISDSAYIENAEGALGYNNLEMLNEDAAGIANMTHFFTQDMEEVSLLQFMEPFVVTTTTIQNDHHLSSSLEVTQQMMNIHGIGPSMLNLPYTHSSFVDQETQPRQMNMEDQATLI